MTAAVAGRERGVLCHASLWQARAGGCDCFSTTRGNDARARAARMEATTRGQVGSRALLP